MSARITRSRSRQTSQTPDPSTSIQTMIPGTLLLKGPGETTPDILPRNLKITRTGMRKADYKLMLDKQIKLRKSTFQVSLQQADAAQAAAATLVFAQHEAGTAVCISSTGLLLTCAHCVHESDGDDKPSGIGQMRWLLFASGRIVHTRCVAWDTRRDLALLLVVAAEAEVEVDAWDNRTPLASLPYVPIASSPPELRSPLHCIGHPGSEDLEASTSGIMTDYDVLHISSGRFRGLAKRQDPQDNNEIGALKHDCWTYWGHSGAPLVERAQHAIGWDLVGLHSSWDDQTGMRRGVPLQAIRAFLREHVDGLEE